MLTRTNSPEADRSAIDRAMMLHCIQLSATAAMRGEFPFAALICDSDRIVVEATNQVAQRADVTRHAELIAVSEAQRLLRRKDLSSCTLYSNVEPCAMCSFPIRETRIGRIVYAISSPFMGGLSKWNVLRDPEIADVMPEAFGPVPEVIAGLCASEAENVWRNWSPLAWAVIKHRGCFGGAESTLGNYQHFPAVPARASLLRKLTMLWQNSESTTVAATDRNSGY